MKKAPGLARRALVTTLLAPMVALLGLVAGPGAPATVPAGASGVVPPIKHVFVIMLENESFATTFALPYYRQLAGQGALLSQYYGVGHVSNDNYLAMISGQGANEATQSDCQDYVPFMAAGAAEPDGQLPGQGCVFPSSVQTIGNQLTDAGGSWKDYDEDMGNIPSRDGTTSTAEGQACGHPTVGSADPTQEAVSGDGYATRHNPFVYFDSVIDDQTYCDEHVVPLGTPSSPYGLAADLRSESTTPNLSYIVPNLCDDGHDPELPPSEQPPGLPPTPGVNECVNEAEPGGLAQTVTFLSTWVPLITGSPAFRDDGMLVITFDEAATSDPSSCHCNTGTQINAPEPGLTGPGGGLIGAMVLSPYVKAHTTSATPYDHFSLLASLEDLFGVPRLALAQSVTATFGSDVYTNPGGAGRFPSLVGFNGYWEAASDGGVFAFGNAPFLGSMGGTPLDAPVVGMAPTPDGQGYWEVASDGGVFAFGDAGYFGSMGGQPLDAPVVGIAPTPDGHGYWEVASDGAVFAFGDAAFEGSMGGHHLNAPVVSLAPTPDGLGYWEVASDGGVFAYGDAPYVGSRGGQPVDAPVDHIAAMPDGGGYWLVASDGGVFAYGDASFLGSMGGRRLNAPVLGLTPTSDGAGYWQVAADGGVFAYGDAPYLGSEGGQRLNAPVVGLAG